MKKHLLFIALTIILIFALCSCGSNPENKLIGSWNGTVPVKMGGYNYIYSYAFYDDGNYDQFSTNEELGSCRTSGHGTWNIVDENHLRINDYGVGPSTFEFKFENGDLILDDETFIKGEIK